MPSQTHSGIEIYQPSIGNYTGVKNIPIPKADANVKEMLFVARQTTTVQLAPFLFVDMDGNGIHDPDEDSAWAEIMAKQREYLDDRIKVYGYFSFNFAGSSLGGGQSKMTQKGGEKKVTFNSGIGTMTKEPANIPKGPGEEPLTARSAITSVFNGSAVSAQSLVAWFVEYAY